MEEKEWEQHQHEVVFFVGDAEAPGQAGAGDHPGCLRSHFCHLGLALFSGTQGQKSHENAFCIVFYLLQTSSFKKMTNFRLRRKKFLRDLLELFVLYQYVNEWPLTLIFSTGPPGWDSSGGRTQRRRFCLQRRHRWRRPQWHRRRSSSSSWRLRPRHPWPAAAERRGPIADAERRDRGEDIHFYCSKYLEIFFMFLCVQCSTVSSQLQRASALHYITLHSSKSPAFMTSTENVSAGDLPQAVAEPPQGVRCGIRPLAPRPGQDLCHAAESHPRPVGHRHLPAVQEVLHQRGRIQVQKISQTPHFPILLTMFLLLI